MVAQHKSGQLPAKSHRGAEQQRDPADLVDWVAYKYRAGTKEEWLGLAEVNRRSVRESAARF